MNKYLVGFLMFLGLLAVPRCCLSAPVIFSGDDVKALKQNFDLNGVAKVLSGTDNPTSVAKSAPKGSIYLDVTNGNVYKKTDAGSSTNWIQLASGTVTGVNLIENPDFEAGILDWTASGGTFAQETTGELFGNASAAWTPSGAQTLTSDAVAIPKGLYGQNCEMTFYYQGGDSNYTAQVYDGTNVLTSLALTASTTAKKVQISFICPTSGNLQARLSASGAATKIIIDSVRISNNESLGVAGQAEEYGKRIVNGTGCSWSKNGLWGAFANDADCNKISLYGNAINPSSSGTPGIKFNNLPPGNYFIEAIGGTLYNAGATDCSFVISDGTNRRGFLYTGSTQTFKPAIFASFIYTTAQTSIEFQIHAQVNSGAGNCSVDSQNSTTNGNEQSLTLRVTRYPLAESQVLKLNDTKQWGSIKWTGSPGDCSITSAAWATCNNANYDSNRTFYGSALSGTNNDDLAIKLNSLPAGSYKVTAVGRMLNYYAASGTMCSFGIYDGTTRGGIGQLYTGADQNAISSISGIFTYSAVGDREFLVQAHRNSGGGGCNIAISDSGLSGFELIVEPIDKNYTMPIIVNGVSTDYSGMSKLLGAKITYSGGTPSIASQTGGISSLTDTGVGQCTINFTAGTFSEAPYCTVTIDHNGDGAQMNVGHITSVSTSSAQVNITASNGTGAIAAADWAFWINCIGKR
jgi:hypothetical protein